MKKIFGFAIMFVIIASSISWAQSKDSLRSYNEYSEILKQIEAPGFDVTSGANLIKRFEEHTGLKFKPAGVYSDPELVPDYSVLRDSLAKSGIDPQIIKKILSESGMPIHGWDNYVSSIKDYNTVSRIFNSVPLVPGKPYMHPVSWMSGTQAGIDASEKLRYIHGLNKKVEYRLRPGDYTTYESLEKKLQRMKDESIEAEDARKRAEAKAQKKAKNSAYPKGAFGPKGYYPPVGDHGVADPVTGEYYHCIGGICH